MDVQPAVAQRAGVGQYTRCLAEHLAEIAGEDEIEFFCFDFRRRGAPFRGRLPVRTFRWCPGRVVQGAWRRFNWPPFDALAGRADVYHFPNFILPPLRAGRRVVTVHDMSFMRFPEYAETRNAAYLASRIRDTVRRADAILTDSPFSAREICSLLSVPEERVHAVLLGVDARFVPAPGARVRETLSRLGINRPYLLSVGTIEPRKNIEFLVDVFEKYADYQGLLVLAGMDGWKTASILNRLRRSPRAARIRRLDYVDDCDLPALYSGADAFLIASFYEGFGLPPLEAMACGTPVISSCGGSLPDVVGSGGRLLRAFDAEAWIAALREVLDDSESRDRRIEAGRLHAAAFTWRQTAERTLEVYRSVA